MKFISLFLSSVFCCLLISQVNAQNSISKYEVDNIVPNFKGTDQFGNPFDLYESIRKGPVVLMFYRGFWCPYCNKQLSQMEDSLSFINEKGGTVVAVTPEKPEGISKTIRKTKASFKIIHDKDLKIMNQFGVGFTISDELNERYKNKGVYIKKNNGLNGPNLPVPATYIIGPDRKILYVFYDPNYRKRATVGKILENL